MRHCSGVDRDRCLSGCVSTDPDASSDPIAVFSSSLHRAEVSIHSCAAEDKKIWSLLGLAFTIIYATMAAMNYMIQLLPVWRSINNGETDGLAMFVLGNPQFIFWGLVYAYIFMNLAMLFSAQAFTGKPLENRIRLFFILNGVSGVFTLASVVLDSPPFYLLGSLVFWCPVFTAAAVSVAVLFKRMGRDGRK